MKVIALIEDTKNGDNLVNEFGLADIQTLVNEMIKKNSDKESFNIAKRYFYFF